MRKVLVFIMITSIFWAGCTRQETRVTDLPQIIPSPPAAKEVLEEQMVQEEKVAAIEQVFAVEGRKNPFLSESEEYEYAKEELELITYLNLTAVFRSSGRAYAVVNGRIVREKDILDNKEIVRISREEIILKDFQGKEYVVRMGSVLNR